MSFSGLKAYPTNPKPLNRSGLLGSRESEKLGFLNLVYMESSLNQVRGFPALKLILPKP